MVFDGDRPDIEVRYAFGLESTKKLKLKSISNESDAILDITPDDEKVGTLLINIRDLRSKQDVWRVNATRKISDRNKSQHEINRELGIILADFPPRS